MSEETKDDVVNGIANIRRERLKATAKNYVDSIIDETGGEDAIALNAGCLIALSLHRIANLLEEKLK